jgi:hypothetical protein
MGYSVSKYSISFSGIDSGGSYIIREDVNSTDYALLFIPIVSGNWSLDNICSWDSTSTSAKWRVKMIATGFGLGPANIALRYLHFFSK